MAKKPVLTAAEAAKMIPDGATVMCGGFLACGQARAIVKELVKLGTCILASSSSAESTRSVPASATISS